MQSSRFPTVSFSSIPGGKTNAILFKTSIWSPYPYQIAIYNIASHLLF